ncbi:MAG TPA: hypothetical protein VIV13_05275 [Solirubrobacterales bacterium]
MAEAGSFPIIRVDPVVPEAHRLWEMALELAEALGTERDWSLIGGLMVQLHGHEHSDDLRPTIDIDLLGAARKPPAMTEQIAAVLAKRGAELAMPPRSDPRLGYRFELDGEIVEVLGPEGLKKAPKTLPGMTTLEISGGTQALRRTEVVLVSLGGAPPVAVRRPSLLGAILIKARVVAKRRKEKFASDREDLIRLLSYVEDPRALASDEGLKSSEKRWLRDVEELLGFSDAGVETLFSAAVLERAQQAFRLLCA